MKAKNDEIERLMAAYEKTSAKRIAKVKAREDKQKAEEKAQELFEENLRKKITEVFRPVMKKLFNRLDKTLFKIESSLLSKERGINECHEIIAIQEEETSFWLAIMVDDQDYNQARLTYLYSVNDKREVSEDINIKPEDIDEALITKIFMLCLRKICE